MPLFHIYTDGACSGNPGPGGWAAIILDSAERELVELSGFDPATTNNRMEIQAAVSGIEKALELSAKPKIFLYSDSSYLIDTYNKGWMRNWLRTDWKDGKVKNRDLWEIMNVLLSKATITWIKVKGHSDNKYNNRCDSLAVAEIKRNKLNTSATLDANPELINKLQTHIPNQTLLPKIEANSNKVSINTADEQVNHPLNSLGVKIPEFDPLKQNNTSSDKPSEQRCLVGVEELAENCAKIVHVAKSSSYIELKNSLDPQVVNSVNSSVAYATYNHPSKKIHPYFLQVGDMADFWLARNSRSSSPHPSPSRTHLIKYMCCYIIEVGLVKASNLGL